MQKLKKPVSILLVFMMIVSLFAIVPISASAATHDSGNVSYSDLQVGDIITANINRLERLGDPPTIVIKGGTYAADYTNKIVTNDLTGSTSYISFEIKDGRIRINDDNTWKTYHFVDQNGKETNQMIVLAIEEDPDTEDCTITFGGFDPNAAPTTYTVTWKNGDTVIETDENVAKDATPEYNGATPTKAFDGKYYYDFKGWTPEITAVTGDATYTAVFEKADINYGEDNKISQDGTVDVSAADEGAALFGLNLPKYNNMQMLGVQKKSAIPTKEGDNGIRFVTAVNTNLLKGSKIDDYGYIVVKAKAGTDTTKIYDKMNNLTYGAVDENVNVFSCKGKSNTISGDFGLYDADTDYKYITLAITGTDGVDATLAARFYIKTTDGKFYYADYIDGNNATHGGMAFDIASVLNNLV